jgi:hypothetical protein
MPRDNCKKKYTFFYLRFPVSGIDGGKKFDFLQKKNKNCTTFSSLTQSVDIAMRMIVEKQKREKFSHSF